MTNTPDILKTILAKKAEEVAKRKSGMSIANLEEIAAGVERPRGFYNAMQNKVSAKKPAIIAEIKKASPSQGVIREDFQPILDRPGLRHERCDLFIGIDRQGIFPGLGSVPANGQGTLSAAGVKKRLHD